MKKKWTLTDPGLLIILVDQSTFVTIENKTTYATDVVNNLINFLIMRNFDGKKAKNRCYVQVISTECHASKLVSGFLQELEENPLRYNEVIKKVCDGDGGLMEVKVKVPLWVEPIYEYKGTDMMGAFEIAKEIVSKWIQDKPSHPAPVIINISNGLPYDGREVEECMAETIDIVNQIKDLNTADGKVQIFNALIRDGETIIFPKSQSQLDSIEAQFLFEISTNISFIEEFERYLLRDEIPISLSQSSKLFYRYKDHDSKKILESFMDYCQYMNYVYYRNER